VKEVRREKGSQSNVPSVPRPMDFHSRVGYIGRIGKEWNPEILNMGIIECLVYSSICGISEIPPFESKNNGRKGTY
jgi:hypothetical protein